MLTPLAKKQIAAIARTDMAVVWFSEMYRRLSRIHEAMDPGVVRLEVGLLLDEFQLVITALDGDGCEKCGTPVKDFDFCAPCKADEAEYRMEER